MSLCTETVNRGDSRWPHYEPCGRVAKEDGLCGLHLAAKKRRAVKADGHVAKTKRDKEFRDEAERLSAALGVRVTADYNTFLRGGGGYTGLFVVPGDWLRKQVSS